MQNSTNQLNQTQNKKQKPKNKEYLEELLIKINKSKQLYLLMALPLAYFIIFKYVPMYGAQIAFRDYIVTKGISESPWVGMKHFTRFFKSYEFWLVIKNTLGLSIYQLVAGFPIPIILALCLNYARGTLFKKTVQMVTYAPHFISVVVMVGMIIQFLSLRTGIVNRLIMPLGFDEINFMGKASYFKSIFVWTGIWQTAGYGSIIYLAALSSIPEELHEAAIVDGANKFRIMWHIDIPCIIPTIVILLILRTGRIMDVGFEKVLLMQNTLNLRSSEIIATYVYKVGLASPTPNLSYPTAIGLFQSLVSFILLISVNKISKRLSGNKLW